MINFRAVMRFDDEKEAFVVAKSIAIENRGYVDTELTGNLLEFNFRCNNYGKFLYTFNDLFSSVSLVLNLIDTRMKK